MNKLNLRNDLYAELLKDAIEKYRYLMDNFPDKSVNKQTRVQDLHKDLYLAPSLKLLQENLADERKIVFENRYLYEEYIFEGKVKDFKIPSKDTASFTYKILCHMYYFLDEKKEDDMFNKGIIKLWPVYDVCACRLSGASITLGIKNEITLMELLP